MFGDGRMKSWIKHSIGVTLCSGFFWIFSFVIILLVGRWRDLGRRGILVYVARVWLPLFHGPVNVLMEAGIPGVISWTIVSVLLGSLMYLLFRLTRRLITRLSQPPTRADTRAVGGSP